MVTEVCFDIALTIDLKDEICLLFLVVDYIVDHVKPTPLLPIYCEI